VKDEFPVWFAGLPEEERQRPHAIGNLAEDPVLVPATKVGGTPREPMETKPVADVRQAPLDCTGKDGVSEAEVRKAQQAWAKYLGRQVEEEDEIAPGVKMKFVLVPPGKFLMGSPKEEQDYLTKTYSDGKRRPGWLDRESQHEVTLTVPFYLGKYKVAQAQYEAVTGKNPSTFKGKDSSVGGVTWEEADAFAHKLTETSGGKLLYRFPTEAEWEYACRGGQPFSPPLGIGNEKSEANALGLYSMHDNMKEWCADWYGDYPSGKVTDPTGPKESSSRVFRGGFWPDFAGYCRKGYDKVGPGFRSSDLGVRLARVPPSGK
jgi:formylglycine-generating enzyme required for sulfatase activity